MGVSSYKYLTSLLLVFLFSSFVSADFTFQGYVQFFNGSVPGIVNVSVYEIDMQQWAVINTTINASIDTATGAFTMMWLEIVRTCIVLEYMLMPTHNAHSLWRCLPRHSLISQT